MHRDPSRPPGPVALPMPSGPPAAQGLYDPALRARRLRRQLRRAHEGPAQPRHRRSRASARCATSSTAARSGAEVNTGDGAGILIQIPDRFLREVVGFALPPEGHYATGIAFLPGRPGAGRPRRPTSVEKIAVSEGLRVLGWRDVPVDDSMIGSTARAVEPSFRQVVPGRRRPGRRDPRAPGLHRPQAHRARGRRPRRRGQRLLPEPVVPHPRLQGHAHHAAAGRVLPRPARRAGRVGAGAGALAVLDQHVPVVAAGPPVPLHRPQRRDQHRAGQPQLDAGPRGAAGQRPAARRPRAHLPDLHARRQRLGHLRRGARAAAHGRLLAAPRRADDDPRGVGEPRSS